ncbi:MAG: hypothetical protein JSV91_08055 [Phycisphaerales bacterium]|nr:MAG: hypothetical protein JSV91_08055 [Phycisphaerales bacterium]
MNIALIQFDIVWEDKQANHRIIEGMVDDADIAPGTFVLLPELSDTGFSLDVKKIADEMSTAWAADLARSRGIWLQTGYAVRGPGGKGRNCATLFAPSGETIGTYEKVHPFSYGRELDHYGSGDHLTLRRLEEIPGRPTVCPLICYDLRFAELWRLGVLAGAEVFTIGANWPDPRQQHWRTLLIARAIENLAYVVAVNRTGSDPHLRYVGGSMIISPRGEVLAEAGEEPAVLRAVVDLEALRKWRDEFGALADIHRDLLGSIRIDGQV